MGKSRLEVFSKIDLLNNFGMILELSWKMFRIMGFIYLSYRGLGSGAFGSGSSWFGSTSHIFDNLRINIIYFLKRLNEITRVRDY